MLDRKTFIKAIESLKEYQLKEDQIYEAGLQLQDLTGNLIDSFITVLEKIMHDESAWISYFCYDLDFGKNYTVGSVTDQNDKEIRLSTIDDLYELLVLDEALRKMENESQN